MDDSESFSLGFNFLAQLGSIPLGEWIFIIGLLVGILILLGISAFISASEIAFFSLEKNDLDELHEENEKKTKLLKSILSEPDKLLATILIVNNTVNIGMVIISTNLFDRLGNLLSPVFNIGLLTITQVVIITTFLLLFGEIIPKVYATKKNKSLSLFMVSPIMGLSKVFSFPARGLVRISKGFDKKMKPQNKNLSVDELSEVHEIVQNKASKQEQKMLDGILEIGQTEAKQIMVPRTDMVTISIEADYQEVLKIINNEGISRIPVYQETLDKIKGVLYIKDLIGSLNQNDSNFKWQELIRQPYFVPETKKLDDLLEEFQNKKIHLALVVDEYGGVEGLVTLEDIIEEIVGDIKDEFDDDDELEYSILGDGKYLFNGKVPLLDVYRVLDVEGEKFDELKGEAETIAGLILEVKGGFPKKGEIIKLENYEFTIEEVDKRRIHRIKLEVK